MKKVNELYEWNIKENTSNAIKHVFSLVKRPSSIASRTKIRIELVKMKWNLSRRTS